MSGVPALNPMFYLYPNDINAFNLDSQYFYGPALLVAPVTKEGATAVDVSLPRDIFYDFHTREKVQGAGKFITMSNQGLTDVPLFLRGGVIIPLRTKSAMTTAEIRTQDFEIVIPFDAAGNAVGTLYLDDGESIDPTGTTIYIEYSPGKLPFFGRFGYKTVCRIAKVALIEAENRSRSKEIYQPLRNRLEFLI